MVVYIQIKSEFEIWTRNVSTPTVRSVIRTRVFARIPRFSESNWSIEISARQYGTYYKIVYNVYHPTCHGNSNRSSRRRSKARLLLERRRGMTHNINSTYIHRMLLTSILSMKYLGRNTSTLLFFLEGISTFRFFNGARVSLGYLLPLVFRMELLLLLEKNHSLTTNSQVGKLWK